MNNTKKTNNRIDNNLKKRILYMVGFFVVDLLIAALMVFAYYWITYRLPRKQTEGQAIQLNFGGMLPSESEAISTENELTTEETFETTTEEPTTTAVETTNVVITLEVTEDSTEEEESTIEDTSEEQTTPEPTTPEPTTEAPTPAPTPEPTTPAPTLPPQTQPQSTNVTPGSWREKFSDKFSATPVMTDTSYRDNNVSVDVTRVAVGSGADSIVYFIADIYVSDIRYFGSGMVNGDTTFQATSSPSYYSQAFPNYVLFTNGDFCGYHQQGIIIRNGMIYRQNPSDADQCVLYADGTMKTYGPNQFTVDMAVANGAWQAWCFGPALLDDNGVAKTSFAVQSYFINLQPRTAIGYFEPGHYCLVVVDGRAEGYSRGMTMYELAAVFQNLGCRAAYNLDGGGSSYMYLTGRPMNNSTNRYVSDFVVLSNTPLI